MESKFFPPPGAVAQPTEYVPPQPSAESPKPEGDVITWTADGSFKAPELNLLRDIPLKPIEAVVPTPVAPSSHKPMYLVIGGVVLVALIGAGAFLMLHKNPAVTVAVTTPSPTPSSTTSPTPSPTATPSTTPSPTATPALAVTQPTVTPTASHPQSSTVTSASGLWLRSSATSVDRSNIIGWMPKGAVVSVDSIGPFWWHGTYKGRSGYFASKYTN